MNVTHQLITQVVLVPEITTKLLTYDRLRWYRSQTGRNGLYEAATSETPTSAVLQGVPISRVLTGKSLRLRIHGTTTLELTLAGPDPVSVSAVADQLTQASPLLTASVLDDALRIETVATGVSASLEVLASDAAPYLGLLVGEGAAGTGADNALVAGLSEYLFSDHQSGLSAWYAVEYRSSTTGVVSLRSAPFPTRALEGVPLSQLVGCFVRLCDLNGQPLAGRRVFIHNVFRPNRVVAGNRAWGVFRQYEELVTDLNGYAETLLVRGAMVDVTIAGTGFTRRITVPQTASLVDLLDPALNPEDEFGIQSAAIDFAIRTT